MVNSLKMSLLPLGLVAWWWVMGAVAPPPVWASTGSEVFRGFTKHISQQIRLDKHDFWEAQTCTSWFYDRLRTPGSSGKGPERVSFRPLWSSHHPLDCQGRYPKGIEAAREAFGQTQQSLSLSLTFFEFALVGDRDDNGQYDVAELRDVFESFGLNFEDRLHSSRYLVSLTQVFDAVRRSGKLQALVSSMEKLLGKGYRFTELDQAALNRQLE